MNDKFPLVSVALSIYNVEAYLPKCLDSIINQTYQNLEIILVNDGSPDNSAKIIDSYALKDKRIKVIPQNNMGLGGGRNTGIDNATGDFITFVDSDDYLAPDFIEYMLDLESKTNADIVISKNCFTTVNMKQVEQETVEIFSSEEATKEFFYPNIRLGAWNKMYRMDFLVKNNLRFVPALKTGEGLQFITNAASYVDKVGVGNRKVYVYRLNNTGSATTKANVERQGIGSLETMEYIRQHLPITSKDVERAYRWHLWNCYRYCLRQIVDSNTKRQYPDLYKKCIGKLRAGFFDAFIAEVPLKQRLIATSMLINPVITIRLLNINKWYQLRVDKSM